jgi:lipoic acid synthetase
MSAGETIAVRSAGGSRTLEVVDLGRTGYPAALEIQEERIERARSGGAESLIFVEHPHVYTLGRGGDDANLGGAGERLSVPVHRVSRGGDVTYHGPGQIVGYPILRLEEDERDVHRYLRDLEEVLVRTLAGFGVVAHRVPGRTGVWVGESPSRKIASIGIGVRRWVTCHGFALNVTTDLEYFRAIVPCAISGVEMTSLAREATAAVDLDAVRSRLLAEFLAVFPRYAPARLRGAAPRRGRNYAARIAAAEPDATGARKPPWIKAKAPTGEGFFRTRKILKELGLHTVCEEAMCPNAGECWGHSTATFMLMGDACTRSCGFCAVRHGAPATLDPFEPGRVASAAERLGLRHVVVTSVNRDDLPDGGAAHFAATARAIKNRVPECAVEVLIPDFQGDARALAVVVASPIDVLNHNTETVPRLYPRVRPGARYARSLDLLRRAKETRRALLVKTGLMLGLGEATAELLETFRDLRQAGCDILTLGQYLRPTREHLPVTRFVTPGEFAELRDEALALGFRHVESGPLVRSSYHAWEHVAPSNPPG